MSSAVDATGNATMYTWIGGDLIGVSDASGSVEMVYDTAGRLTDATSPTETLKNVYGPTTGLLDYSVGAGTDTTRYTYDTRGRVWTVSDPEHHVTTYDYTDPSGWMNTRSVSSGGRVSTFRYDTYGRLAGATNPEGRETVYQYDVLDRQRFVTTPDLGITELVWGRIFLDRVNDPRGLSYQWTRNALGQVETEIRPGDTLGVHLTTAYDRYGRPTSSTNRRGQQVTVGYDAQDRVISRTADGQTTTFGFSPNVPSNPNAPSWVAVSNVESTDTVAIDERGRLTSSVSRRSLAGGIVQRYELQPRYDAYDRPVGLVVLQPLGVRDSIGYSYSPSTSNLASMRDLAAGTTNFGYNRDGLATLATLPTTQSITYGYTSTHMPRSILYGAIGVNAAAGVEYDYDLLNRMRSRVNPARNRDREFVYDLNGGWLSAYSDYKQTGSTHPTCTTDPDNGTVCTDPTATLTYDGGDTFAYDLGGNPTTHGAVVGAANRLAQFNGYTLGYDLDGNLISKTKAGFSQTFTWNSLNQLTSVTTNGVTVGYGYDGMGQRVRRQVNGSDTGYLYDGGNLLLEYSGNGVQAKYTYYPGSSQPHSVVRGGQTYYYATDVQGSVLALFNGANTVVNQYGYLPFGEAQGTPTETVTNRLRYAGRELESESGLYYNNARWYDPSLHRFVSEDPIGIDGGMNLYAYVGNDPANGTDPSGLLSCVLRNGGSSIGNPLNGPAKGFPVGGSPYWDCDWWGMSPATFADLRTEYDSKCTWRWHCPGDPDMNPPDEAEWRQIRRRVDQIVSPDSVCPATRQILENWYAEGRTSRHFMVWTETWVQGGILHGVPLGTSGIGLSHDYLMGNPSRGVFVDRYVVVHEALHIYANNTPGFAPPQGLVPLRGGYGDTDEQGSRGLGWVYQMQRRCTQR